MDSRQLGVFSGLGAGLAFGLLNLLVRVNPEQMPAAELVCARGWLGALVLTPWVYSSLPVLFQRQGQILWLRSLAGALAVFCLFLNLQYTGVGDATTLSNLSAFFVVLLSWLFLRERIRPVDWVGMGVVFVGASLLQSPLGSDISWKVMGIGILGAFSASLAYLALRQAAQRFSPLLVVWSFCFASGTVAFFAPSQSWGALTLGQGWILTAVAILGLAGQILMTHAFMRLPAAVAAVLNLSAVVWGVGLESLYTGELPSGAALLSYFLILGGVFILQVKQDPRVKKT